MFEFINKCFENDVSVEFERDNYLPYRPVRVTLTKNNYHLVRVFLSLKLVVLLTMRIFLKMYYLVVWMNC